MSVFYLKQRDTLPALEVSLKNPDGTPHDLTGATSVALHVKVGSGRGVLNPGAVVSRVMTVVSAVAGRASYAWVAADWDPLNVAGYLSPTPPLPLVPGEAEHAMEYEVLRAGGARQTFPNGGYDTLRCLAEIGQG